MFRSFFHKDGYFLRRRSLDKLYGFFPIILEKYFWCFFFWGGGGVYSKVNTWFVFISFYNSSLLVCVLTTLVNYPEGCPSKYFILGNLFLLFLLILKATDYLLRAIQNAPNCFFMET